MNRVEDINRGVAELLAETVEQLVSRLHLRETATGKAQAKKGASDEALSCGVVGCRGTIPRVRRRSARKADSQLYDRSRSDDVHRHERQDDLYGGLRQRKTRELRMRKDDG